MNRFVATLVKGSARLAFWRKPAAASPDEPQPDDRPHAPAPEPARQVRSAEAEPNADVDVPAHKPGWFARVKNTFRRAPSAPEPAPEPSAATDQSESKPRPSRDRAEAGAAADTAPPSAPSFLARLASKLRRTSQPEQPEAEADAATPRAEKNRNATASEATPADDADAVPVSRMRRALAVLANKWIWIPAVSFVLIAAMTGMLVMLVQSKHEQQQLQTKLLATQKELKQTTLEKQVAMRSDPVKHAGAHQPSQAGEPGTAEDPLSGFNDTDCVVTDRDSVIKNLKNCIESFNSASAE